MPSDTTTPESAPTMDGRDDLAPVKAALADEGAYALDAPANGGSRALTDAQRTALAKLREELPAHLLSQKPVDVKAKWNPQLRKFVDQYGGEQEGMRCGECGQFLPARHGHLTYAGHAAITDRMLEVDPDWNWEPVTDPAMLAVLPREHGGMWIKLTVAGVTRLGYGDAQGKTGHNAVKEIIGDALRNAGMRFGIGLGLWHKGDLHADQEAAKQAEEQETRQREALDKAQAVADEAAQEVGDRDPRAVLQRLQDLHAQATQGELLAVTIAAEGKVGPLGGFLHMRITQVSAAAAEVDDGEAEARQQASQEDPRADDPGA